MADNDKDLFALLMLWRTEIRAEIQQTEERLQKAIDDLDIPGLRKETKMNSRFAWVVTGGIILLETLIRLKLINFPG